jgi:hypothetical protein
MGVSYKGTVKNSVIVLRPEAKLPEGATVEVIPSNLKPEEQRKLTFRWTEPNLLAALQRFAPTAAKRSELSRMCRLGLSNPLL